MGGIVEHVANVLLPVLFCMLLGFGLSVAKTQFDTKLYGFLVSNVGYPALKVLGVPVRAYLCPMMLANVGSVGLSVARYQPEEAPVVAGLILVSTALTLVTLPVVLTFWATG